MADPIVGITNGVPTSGTGNITTLGQTLLDGANIVLGATSDLAVTAGAFGSVSGKLRAISRDIVGGIVLQSGANTIGAVSQAGAPWSVSGTVAATQSGAWNITNITGSIPLPPLAATSTLQPTNAAIASATAGQTGNIAMGATTTGAPGYTTGQTNPLSLTTAGALRVDGSAVTQPVSGSVSVTGTVSVTESGTWTVQPGNTPNTTPWLMTIQQGGNPATVSAAGALKVDGSAATQPISATALPLPAGAATAANQASAAAQGSTTAGQLGTLAEGAVTSGAPTYTNGTTQPFTLTIAGAIRVDGSAATQPVSGTIAATQSGTWSSRTLDGFGNAISSDIRGTSRPLAVEILDASGNQITSFGAGSGPSFGSTFPTAGSAVGFSDGTNMQAARVFDGDSGAGTQYSLGVLLKTPASGGAVDIGVSGQPLRIDPTGTTAQPVTGTFWQATQPISGTVTANQGGAPWTTKPDGTAWSLTGTSANVNVSNASIAVTGTFWQATQPVSGTVTVNGTIAATQSGAWNITNITGTVSLPALAATSTLQPSNATLGSSTSGQTGTVVLGAVTGGVPSYTTATSNALSLTLAGALRVDASGTTQPVSGTVTANQGGTWTVQPGNTANTTPWLTTISQGGNNAAVTVAGALKIDGSGAVQPVSGTFWQTTQPVSGTLAATQSGTWTVQQGTPPWLMGGDVANAAADSGNPVKIGAVARTANPTAVTTGQRVNLMADKLGKLVAVGAVRDLKGVQKTSISVNTETTVVTAGAAGVFNDVYAIVVTNKSATAVFVDFKDATAGTTRMTLAAPANDTRGFTVTVDSAMVQAVAANNWTATVSSAVTSIEITMLYVSNT